MAKARKYPVKIHTSSKAEETGLVYRVGRKIPARANFTSRHFEKISSLLPFTQKEWSNILHLSERTLQRYSKENKKFEGIYTDRILHIEKLLKAGLETFSSAEAFYRWLKKDKIVLGQALNFESLYATQGIQDLLDEIMRIQHGIYI